VTFPLSVLDLAPVRTGSTAQESFTESLALARLADRLGFARYWFAEHHGMPSIASSAPEILIAHVAASTERIRVGSGGIMLQNHVPLKVAETFHTLETLHPGRIDLGIGRAPGTDPTTSRALRPFGPERFREQLTEVIGLSRGDLPSEHPFRSVRVIPAGVALPPIWLLGSSGASAMLAGSLGVGYSFASHFSPAPARPAFDAYRESFTPSPTHPAPHAILAVSAICAETSEEAHYLAATGDLMWVRLHRGEFSTVPSPEEALAYPYTPRDREVADSRRALSFVGTPDEVRERIEEAARSAGADEIMVSSIIYSPSARRRSMELLIEG
jgi:luciferase family oxidoreductase group 1